MKFEISSDTIKRTTKCSDNFSCLSGKKDCLCEVENDCESNSSAVFVQPQEKKGCNYKMDFGYGWICNCPTRKTLNRKYSI